MNNVSMALAGRCPPLCTGARRFVSKQRNEVRCSRPAKLALQAEPPLALTVMKG
jgi:hypothetical protein